MGMYPPPETMERAMTQNTIIDFLSNAVSHPGHHGGAWDEAGRAIEAGYRAPLPIGPRLVMAIALMLPLLLLPLLGHAFLTLVRIWAN
jgi:hypothetical protein